MFESIQQGLSEAFRKLRGVAKFTEANMQEGLREVRRALLEADVNVDVAGDFIKQVEKAAVGRQVLKSLNPSQQIVEVVYEELVRLMGPVDPAIRQVPGRATVLMMCGLQGSGKTTTCAKLAKLMLSQGRQPMLVAADLQRPAAIEQLKVLGAQIGVPVYSEESTDPVKVCQNGVAAAKAQGRNLVILDTAGRLHIDDELMQQLKSIDKRVGPDMCMLVADAMTGQDAVRSAKAFNDALELDGLILTKLDGDARGGAALSIKHVTGVPIKYVGMGEKIDDIEPFRPEGMASRVLGMGDVLSLVNKAKQAYDMDEAAKQQEKLEKGKFDLNDFRDQIEKIRGMGSTRQLMEMLPGGLGKMIPEGTDPEEEMGRVTAILNSMTAKERANPEILDISRRRRVAQGSGVEHPEVNKLIKQFDQMRGMMKQMASMSMMDRMKSMIGLGQTGAMPGGTPGMKQKERSERNPRTSKEIVKARKQERQRKKKNRNPKR